MAEDPVFTNELNSAAVMASDRRRHTLLEPLRRAGTGRREDGGLVAGPHEPETRHDIGSLSSGEGERLPRLRRARPRHRRRCATANRGKIERMEATSRDHVVFVVGTVVLAEGNPWPIWSTTSDVRMRIPKWRKR